jgi:hypothetical protein
MPGRSGYHAKPISLNQTFGSTFQPTPERSPEVLLFLAFRNKPEAYFTFSFPKGDSYVKKMVCC